MAGARAVLSLAEPVRELSAQRLRDKARLIWIWPGEAVDSIIAWPGGERRCSRQMYDHEGGVTIPVGPDEVIVTVSAVHPHSAAEPVAIAIPATVQARKAEVRYRGKTKFYCPYCYSQFAAQEIKFRCTGQPSRLGKRCELVVDEVLRDRTGSGEALPPVFAADGRSTKAECPICKGDTTTRICPACHSTLPVYFGKVNSRLIAVVGAKESGKSVFMTVLIHELLHRVGSQFDVVISGANDGTRVRFAENYERPLYQELRLLSPSTALSQASQQPLVFRFTTQERRLIGSAESKHALLSFFDTPGKNFTTQRSVEENFRYLAAADAIVLLLDPLQMRGARELAQPGTSLPARGSVADDPANVLASITDLMTAVHGGPKKRISTPLAIAFTKLDALTHDLKETSPLRRPAPQAPFFDETDSQEVHAEILQLLTRWKAAGLTSSPGCTTGGTATSACPHWARPRPRTTWSPRAASGLRVADPILWALGGFGLIKVRKGS